MDMDRAPGSSTAAVAACRACEELLAGGGRRLVGRRRRARPPAAPRQVDGLLTRASDAASAACAEGPVLEVPLSRARAPDRGRRGHRPSAPLAVGPPVPDRAPGPAGPARRAAGGLLAGSRPRAARNSLNVAITLLRRAFRPVYGDCPVVVFRDESYALDPRLEVRVDAEDFERLAREGDALRRAGRPDEAAEAYRRADERYGGPLFEDEPYEEWIVTARREVEGRHLDVLGHLGDCLAELGDHEASAGAYRRILAAEPHRDDVRRLVAEQYEALGRPGLALRPAPLRNARQPHVVAA